jgi:hypothetical protein
MCGVCQRDVTTPCFPPFNKNKLLVIAVTGRRGFPSLSARLPVHTIQRNLKALMDFRASAAYEQPDTPQTVGRLPREAAHRYQSI